MEKSHLESTTGQASEISLFQCLNQILIPGASVNEFILFNKSVQVDSGKCLGAEKKLSIQKRPEVLKKKL